MKIAQQRWIIGLTTLALLASVGSAWAKGPGCGGKKAQALWGEGKGMAHDLDLTADQLAKFKQDQQVRQKRMIQLRAELQTLKIDLAAEATAAKPDKGKIKDMTVKMGELKGQMTYERIEGQMFLRSLLTPEQTKKFDSQHSHFGGMGFGHAAGRGFCHAGDEKTGR